MTPMRCETCGISVIPLPSASGTGKRVIVNANVHVLSAIENNATISFGRLKRILPSVLARKHECRVPAKLVTQPQPVIDFDGLD